MALAGRMSTKGFLNAYQAAQILSATKTRTSSRPGESRRSTFSDPNHGQELPDT